MFGRDAGAVLDDPLQRLDGLVGDVLRDDPPTLRYERFKIVLPPAPRTAAIGCGAW